jgi:hypothetical protein
MEEGAPVTQAEVVSEELEPSCNVQFPQPGQEQAAG